jgi:uncharacterized protein involved in exopolysaccharide biosynthesis
MTTSNAMIMQEAVPYRPEADSFHFGGALQTIAQAVRTYIWVVLATIALTVSVVGAYIWIWPSTFQAEVMVAVDSDKDQQRTAFYQGWNIFRKEGLIDEGVLMTSPPVLKEVIRRLDLKYEDVYHPFMRYAIHLWTQSWVGRNYRKVKQWILGTENRPGSLSPEDVERAKVLSDMETGLSVKQVGEASIGQLSVKGSNYRVYEIANTIVDVYLEQRRERHVAEATQAVRSLTEEANKTKVELEEVARRLRDFRAASGTSLLFEKDRGEINQLLALRTSITELRSMIEQNHGSIKVLDGQLAAEGENLKSNRVFAQDAQKDRLPKLEMALAQARQSYQPDSREVKDLEQQIREAQQALNPGGQAAVVRNSVRVSDNYEQMLARKHQLQATMEGARSAMQVKERELAALTDKLQRLPYSMQVNHELERLQGDLENKYSGINSKLVVAAVSLATARSAPPAMRVIEPAHVPDQASAPQTKLLLAAAVLAGTVVGALLALMLDLLSPRASRGRLTAPNSTLPLLGVVAQDERLLRSLFMLPGPASGTSSSRPRALPGAASRSAA